MKVSGFWTLVAVLVGSASIAAADGGPIVGANYFGAAGGACGPAGFGCYDPCGSCRAGSRYFSVFGGWTQWDRIDGTLAFQDVAGADTTVDYNFGTRHGWNVGGALGRYFTENIRGEVEFAYRNNSFDQFTGAVTTNAQAVEVAEDLDGRLNVFSSMVNGYYEFSNIGRGWVRPYVGAGAGVAFVDADVSGTTVPVQFDGRWSTFAYQLMAGVSVQVSERVDLFTEYRYLGTDRFRFNLSTPGTTTSADLEGRAHNVMAGVRFSFR